MIDESQKLEKSLLTIIKEVFSYWIDPQKQEKQLTINPELNMEKLQELVEKARDIIIQLYVNCEKDFQKGLEIFESIIRSKMVETSQKRIANFDKKAEQLKESKTDHIPNTDVEPMTAEEKKEIVVETEQVVSDTSSQSEMPSTQINSNVNININQPSENKEPNVENMGDSVPDEKVAESDVIPSSDNVEPVTGGRRRRRRKTRKIKFYRNKSRKKNRR